MQIHSVKLRKAYHRIKAANVLRQIETVTKAPHDAGKFVEAPEGDVVKGVPDSLPNESVTNPAEPTSHLQPKDPEFNTDQIVSGTGSGPTMGSNRNYL